MAVLIECPSCQRKLRLADTMVGRPVKCPACSTAFTASAGSPEELPVPIQAVEEKLPPLRGPGEFNPGPFLPADSGPPSALLDYLAFRRMITPVIIQILFWLLVASCVFGGLAMILVGLFSWYRIQPELILLGLFLMAIGPIMVRIYCEILFLFFRMNETLTDIKNQLSGPR